MMGLAQYTDKVPVIKGTSGIVVLDGQATILGEPKPCIYCSRCLEVCPMKLTPTIICTLIEFERYEEAADKNMLDCIECGSCTYICPTKRNLVHLIKLGKLELNELLKKAEQKKIINAA
jgi:electron transport complex protein RnfC